MRAVALSEQASSGTDQVEERWLLPEDLVDADPLDDVVSRSRGPPPPDSLPARPCGAVAVTGRSSSAADLVQGGQA